MSHNYSDRKLHALDAAELSRLVSRWIFGKDSRVEEPQTPAGVLARGATLQARCGKRSDCGRRVTFDAAQWCDAGHALTALSDVLLAYACGLVPCRLQWLPERYPAGRPFGTYLRDGKASVVVRCECREFKPKEYPLLTFVKAMLAGAGPGALAWPLEPVRLGEGPVILPARMVRGQLLVTRTPKLAPRNSPVRRMRLRASRSRSMGSQRECAAKECGDALLVRCR